MPPSRNVKDRVFDLIERHGDDYVVEGKKLLRRLRLTVTVAGIIVAVSAAGIAVLVAIAVLR